MSSNGGVPMSEVINYDRDGGISTIRIDDGKANVMSVATMTALQAALDQAEADGTVVVLTGREGLFSAGFDLNVFKQGVEPAREMLLAGARLAARILTFPAPFVVACTGHAIAMGSFLLMAADLRIGAKGAYRLGMNEVAIGLTVPLFAIEIARQRVPASYLSRNAILAEMHSPTDAVAAGFLDHVVPPDDVLPTALEHANRLSGLDMAAHKATKLRLRAHVAEAVRDAAQTDFGG
jgi:enoyl-CoA hydratase